VRTLLALFHHLPAPLLPHAPDSLSQVRRFLGALDEERQKKGGGRGAHSGASHQLSLTVRFVFFVFTAGLATGSF
jgi:hypothetical protein